jgi:lipopolysaccharide/colanic/teichoic acid biosynthesis glycosyltransferase
MKEQAVSVATLSHQCPAIPFWKRLLDLVCVFAALPFVAPLMVIIAILIKIISRGPALFKQDRIGYLGSTFKCFKFRTMKTDSSVGLHQTYLKDLIQCERPMTKMDQLGDPRLFPLASFLRATGLDELPQILNVLRGEMSLVGPRPCLPYEYENYLPWQRRRFHTLPGITGLWQVSGKNKTTFNEMINLDISYIANRSLWKDLKIMLKTFPVLGRQFKELLQR